jgi:hypothetical protein
MTGREFQKAVDANYGKSSLHDALLPGDSEALCKRLFSKARRNKMSSVVQYLCTLDRFHNRHNPAMSQWTTSQPTSQWNAVSDYIPNLFTRIISLLFIIVHFQ